MYYLNNCRNFPHSKKYGVKAMFDLWPEGFEDKVARELSPGTSCLVASRADKDNIAFDWYRFTGTRLEPDAAGEKRSVWVLDGELERHEVLPRAEAISRAPYSKFFNKRGHFNQWSVTR